MKSINFVITITLALTLFSSCTSYQFATLKSDLPQPSDEGFLFENDTIEVVYAFNGVDCPISLSIYNKLNSPILINWNQSAIVINGSSFPLNPNESVISTNYSESKVNINNTYEYTDGSMYGRIDHDDQSGFIPPKSQLNINEVSVISDFLPTANASSKSTKILHDRTYQPHELKTFDFDKEQTPLEFRCFLSYSDKNKTNHNSIDHHFWVSSLCKTTGLRLVDRADRYYVTKTSDAGTIIGIAAVAGIVVVAAKYGEFEEEEESF